MPGHLALEAVDGLRRERAHGFLVIQVNAVLQHLAAASGAPAGTDAHNVKKPAVQVVAQVPADFGDQVAQVGGVAGVDAQGLVKAWLVQRAALMRAVGLADQPLRMRGGQVARPLHGDVHGRLDVARVQRLHLLPEQVGPCQLGVHLLGVQLAWVIQPPVVARCEHGDRVHMRVFERVAESVGVKILSDSVDVL